jgi:hypothetical protein
VTQPSWACSGRTAARMKAKPRSARPDFFIEGLHWRR